MRLIGIFILACSLALAAEKPLQPIQPRPQEPHWKAKVEEMYPSGQPAKIVFYEELGDEPPVAVKLVCYHPNGQIKMESDVTSSQDNEGKMTLIPNGVEINLDERGNVEKVAHHVKGALDGEMRLFYPTGQMKAICHFKEGKRHGPAIIYHLEGNKAEELQYADDKIVGDLIKYYPNGGKAALVAYEDGVPHGKATEWYESGAVKSMSHYEKGLLDSNGKNPALVIYSEDHAMLEVQD
ncbi:MAG TPA: toxin-antitoxin system YwqK family antitoxin, partial [Candidatus Babeliaceae bacterium]|nr:toxin-antitoxin system YwqK family antitoxin [Candidatus Babeliaceae bacterium]